MCNYRFPLSSARTQTYQHFESFSLVQAPAPLLMSHTLIQFLWSVSLPCTTASSKSFCASRIVRKPANIHSVFTFLSFISSFEFLSNMEVNLMSIYLGLVKFLEGPPSTHTIAPLCYCMTFVLLWSTSSSFRTVFNQVTTVALSASAMRPTSVTSTN